MDILIFILILFLGYSFPNVFKNELTVNQISDLRKIWFYHLVFGIYFCFFIISDSIGYWGHAKELTPQTLNFYLGETGTFFMFALNYFPSNILGLSYFSGTMIYTFIGFIGLTFFYLLAIKLIPYNSKFRGYNLFPLLFFLPNLHFWSCSTGKDTLLFFCIGAFSYSLLSPLRRVPLIILSLTLAYLVRPHMALMMLVGFGFGFMLGTKISFFYRLVASTVFIFVAIKMLPSVMEIDGIQEASIESFSEFSEAKADLLSRSNVGSAVDISSYPFPLKVFSFLFRPFFFDINGIPAVLASFENLLLLLLTIKVLRNKPIATFRKAPYLIKGFVIFLIVGTLSFSQSLGNIGIMIRMRNMFLPGFIIFILWSLSLNTKRRI